MRKCIFKLIFVKSYFDWNINDLIYFVKCLLGGSLLIVYDGWVLVNNMNGIGIVCGYMWDDIDVDVFCC